MQTALEALKRLQNGNKKYLTSVASIGDISPELREKTAKEGQQPYAAIITCSDSRVMPESIFSAGIGELFVIRSAGFTIDDAALGSIEYAVEHLGIPLVVVMGHTQCGAVGTALKHEAVTGHLQSIIREIEAAIGNETDYYEAVKLNVKHSCDIIKTNTPQVMIVEAVYHIDTGEVEFNVRK